jgi:beta-mannosidase
MKLEKIQRGRSKEMIKTSLNGTWNLDIVNGQSNIPATIPGSVYSALLESKQMEDPFWRDNELSALALMDHDFVFTKKFDAPSRGRSILVCEGLDTICELELNGVKFAQTDNMHRRWEFDITSLLLEHNTLTVYISSPTRFIAEADKLLFTDGSTDAMRGFPQIRKAHCMFGWDWGPRLPDAGIWRDIYILNVGQETTRIEDVLITQKHGPGFVDLDISVLCFGQVSIEVLTPDGEKSTFPNGNTIRIENPELWWPNSYGAQALYRIRVISDTDIWERKIGLRTIDVSRNQDEFGESFAFCVNGVDIFAMGANYIPEDNILSRMNPQRTRRLLEDAALANFNSIRVWGGGFYPDDWFYDLCDELGLIVWQDFMFACSVYELTPDFDLSIREEIRDNVKRLRHHASLGLLCGNNEMEWQYDDMNITPKQKGDYYRIFEYIIPQEVKALAPQTFYWSASPSSGGGFDNPNDASRGDAHYWDVWHGMKPFSEYRKFMFRFTSEFGFQSFPSLRTIESFTLPEDRNIFSRVMEMHQRNAGANGRILYYLSMMYRYPGDFEGLVYTSQLLQADAIRYGVEHWRRNRGQCMGAIYWQLNDIWPVASWSSVDYFGRWKALHYFAKRFFAPILLSCEETGEMTERPSCVCQPKEIRKAAHLSVANETMESIHGVISWSLRDPSSAILKSGTHEVTVSKLTSQYLDEVDFSDCDELSNYLSYELEICGEIVSRGTALFCSPKHFAFQDPKLSVSQDGSTVTVTSRAYAKSIEVYSDTEDFLLSDNFFDLSAGSVTLQVLRGQTQNLKVRSVYDIGRVDSHLS